MMYHLKLKKALSYDGVVSATRKCPDVYTEDKAKADAAVASGYFDLVEAIDPAAAPAAGEGKTVTGHLDYDQLMDMKLTELKALAEEMFVPSDGLRTKDDFAKAICAVTVQAPAEAIAAGEGEADFSEE